MLTLEKFVPTEIIFFMKQLDARSSSITVTVSQNLEKAR